MKNIILLLFAFLAMQTVTAQNIQPTPATPIAKQPTVKDNAIRPMDTMRATSVPQQRNIKHDTKPSVINGNANPDQHISTPGNTKISPVEVDHTLPPGTQRVDGTTPAPPKK